jgi:hypothetical protein
VVGGTFEGGGGGSRILAADADAGDAARDGQVPEHVFRRVDLEGEGGEERAEDYEERGEEDSGFARVYVGCVAEEEDADYGADEEGVGEAGLRGGGVGCGAEEVLEYYVCGRGLYCWG